MPAPLALKAQTVDRRDGRSQAHAHAATVSAIHVQMMPIDGWGFRIAGFRGTSLSERPSSPTASMAASMTRSLGSNACFIANVKVSVRSQPPLVFDLSVLEPAGSGSLHRLVGR